MTLTDVADLRERTKSAIEAARRVLQRELGVDPSDSDEADVAE
jgi:hypothetical protein